MAESSFGAQIQFEFCVYLSSELLQHAVWDFILTLQNQTSLSSSNIQQGPFFFNFKSKTCKSCWYTVGTPKILVDDSKSKTPLAAKIDQWSHYVVEGNFSSKLSILQTFSTDCPCVLSVDSNSL